MKSTDIIQPKALSQPIATDGKKNNIPENATGSELASVAEGFPAITMENVNDGGLPPRGEDCNGMFYLSTDQRVFLQNGGIITFSQEVSDKIGGYPEGAILDYIDPTGAYNKVKSLIDDNTNNFNENPAFIDNINWSKIFASGGSSRNAGELVYSLLPQTDTGLHLLDGSLISGIGSYRAFVSYIANLYGDGTNIPAYFTTEEEWQQSVANYGVCGKFVFNQEAYTVRLPKVTGFIEGTLDATTLGSLIEAGLPALDLAIQSAGAHTHTRGTMNITGNASYTDSYPSGGSFSGALYKRTDGTYKDGGGNSAANTLSLGFDASRNWTGATSSNGEHTHAISGNSIIGKTNTVQPQAINGYIYIVIATSVKTEIEVDIDNITNDLKLKAETDLSNLTSAGEKHFLNYTQVTNCIKEIPQRVKYTLNNGTLTILKGSVAIVPYGTEDLTGTHPIGSTFINDNFKVVDTQFANGKFFVWVELQNDISQNSTVGDTAVAERFVALNISGEIAGSLIWNVNSSSGDTAPTSGSWQWYQLTNNKIVHTVSGSTVDNSCLSFPILKAISNNGVVFSSVSKVFNGWGNIGSTVWVDKGVKALFPNGSNNDGTVNNIDWTNPQLFIYTFPDNTTNNYNLYLRLPEPTPNSPLLAVGYWGPAIVFESTQEPVTPGSGVHALWYNPDVKIWQETTGNGIWTQVYFCPMGSNTTTDGVISNAVYKHPFVAADAQDFANVQDLDGKWTSKSVTLVNNANYPTANDTVINLSSQLPKDNNVYEIILEADVVTGAASGNYCNCVVSTSLTKVSVISCRTRTNSTTQSNSSVIIPLGANKILTVIASSGYVGKYTLYLKGYRKVR